MIAKTLLLLCGLLSLYVVTAQEKSSSQQRWYLSWGYNRAWHQPSSMTWTTAHGQFTIEDAQAVDRPSPFDPAIYFSPGKISIPQYNVRLGWEKKTRHGYWGLELGQDHMKWVFQNTETYTITGDYNGELYALDGHNKTYATDFAKVKAQGDATPFRMEYSDGHNYPHLAAFYLYELYASPSRKLALLAGPDAGLGIYFPRPHATMLDSTGYYRGENGRFQLSGFGMHASLRARISLYDRVFIESCLRGVAIRNKSKLYSPMHFSVRNKGLMLSTQFLANVSVVLWKL